jgi:phosphatidylinositol alpha-mannosyltransferase
MSVYDHAGNPHYGGGGAVVVHEVAVRLLKDHRITVYCGSYSGSGRSEVTDGVRYVFLPVGWAGPRAGQLLFQVLLPFVAMVVRPDLWIESLTPPFSASLLPLVRRRPVIALVQMLGAADMARRYRLPFTAVERRGLRLYRRFIVLNATDADAVATCAPRATVALIPNGIIQPHVRAGDFGAGRHILVLGRIDVRQKGLDLLLAAVGAEPPALPVVIAGSGTRAEVRKLAEVARQVRPPIVLAGRVSGEQKSRLLRDAAFVVVPSRFETFSLTALEAMAYGKPVVCFDLPRLAWIRPDCGVRVPPFDVAALGRAIHQLAADPATRATLGRQAHALSSQYDWDVIGERYRALVAEALAGTVQPAGRK